MPGLGGLRHDGVSGASDNLAGSKGKESMCNPVAGWESLC